MDTKHRALVVVDLQNEYVEGPLAIAFPPREQSHAAVLRAIEAAETAQVPVIVVRHRNPAGAPAFADGSVGHALHPDVAERIRGDWLVVDKAYASVFAGTGAAGWLHERSIDTVTLVGYMTNNCILATAAEAAAVGLTAEVLRDATGAIDLANDAGEMSAQALHEALMVLLHSNFAATATVDQWIVALRDGTALAKSNLIASAIAGVALAGR